MFFHDFLLRLILVFISTVCALSLSDVSIIEPLLLTLSRWQSFPSKLEHFLIQNTFRQPPLLWLLVTSAMNQYLTLKINHTDKRLVFQIICIYRYSKCYLMLNFICIFCLSWNFFYSRDRISILFYIYDSHKSSFIRVSVTNYAN